MCMCLNIIRILSIHSIDVYSLCALDPTHRNCSTAFNWKSKNKTDFREKIIYRGKQKLHTECERKETKAKENKTWTIARTRRWVSECCCAFGLNAFPKITQTKCVLRFETVNANERTNEGKLRKASQKESLARSRHKTVWKQDIIWCAHANYESTSSRLTT